MLLFAERSVLVGWYGHTRNKSVALSLRGLRIINLAAALCIRCRRATLTADVPYKSALQYSSQAVMS